MDTVKCRIADFNIDFTGDINVKAFSYAVKDYLFDFRKADISAVIDDLDVQYEVENDPEEHPKAYLTTYKQVALFRKFAESLPEQDAFLLHSATFDIGGQGIAFAAHSGTGKTTHMNLWQKYLGDKMVVVNGDKPIIRFFSDEPNTPYAYGNPWNGKEHLGQNMRTILRHICFIERSPINYVETVSKEKAIERIMKQAYIPRDPQSLSKTMELVGRLLDNCKLWIIHCNMEPEAAEIAYKGIFGNS